MPVPKLIRSNTATIGKLAFFEISPEACVDNLDKRSDILHVIARDSPANRKNAELFRASCNLHHAARIELHIHHNARLSFTPPLFVVDIDIVCNFGIDKCGDKNWNMMLICGFENAPLVRMLFRKISADNRVESGWSYRPRSTYLAQNRIKNFLDVIEICFGFKRMRNAIELVFCKIRIVEVGIMLVMLEPNAFHKTMRHKRAGGCNRMHHTHLNHVADKKPHLGDSHRPGHCEKYGAIRVFDHCFERFCTAHYFRSKSSVLDEVLRDKINYITRNAVDSFR